MFSKLRPHLTYANVMVTALMFIVLGGGAYAAGTIGSDDVTNDSLRSVDLKDGAAVTSQDVKDAASGSDAIDADTVDGKHASQLKTARIRAGTGVDSPIPGGGWRPLFPGLEYLPGSPNGGATGQTIIYFKLTNPADGTANVMMVASGIEQRGSEVPDGFGPIYAENGASDKGQPVYVSDVGTQGGIERWGQVSIVLPNDTGTSQAETQLIIDAGSKTYSIALHQYMRASDNYWEIIGTATLGE